MIANDNNKEKALSAITRSYAKYDALFSDISSIETQRDLDADGLSLISDVEYYLQPPDYHAKFENLLLQLLKEFSGSILQEK